MRRSFLLRTWVFLLGVPLVMNACAQGTADTAFSQAHWIAAPGASPRDGAETDGSRPMPLFRRVFPVSRAVAHAELRIAGLGQFQASIGWEHNFQLVTPKGLHQAWTDYRKTVTYATYDVTGKLQTSGPHVLAVALGNGMYNVQRTVLPSGKARYTKFEGSYGPPRLIAELTIHYRDGRTVTIASDTAWKTKAGPTLFSSIYGGEDYDARKLPRGWDQPDFNDQGWQQAQAIDGPGGALTAALAPEVEQAAMHAPVRVTRLDGGKVVYDLGQNFAGIPHIHAMGAAGAILKLTPGELLNADGTVSQRSSGGPAWWTYTLAGDRSGEDWEPQFGYYGFRYVQVEWLTAPAGLVDLTGIELHSASPVTGDFSTSNETLNRIHALITTAMHNNEVSIFTDCPHREKLGWLEETHLVADAMLFNNDLRGLYAATSANIANAQTADGAVPTIAPQYTKFGPRYAIYDDSPEWGSAAILAPWASYRFFGDRAALARQYPVMQRYLGYLHSRAKDGIVAYGLGDWYDVGPGGPGFSKNTTLGVTATLMLFEDADTLSRIATLLQHPEDAAAYRSLADATAVAFNRRFWNAASGWYDTGSQTANAMPLALGIVPPERRAVVIAHLVADLHAHGDHLTTGEVGFPYLLRALTAARRDDLVLALMLRPDPPSYAAQLNAGATALTEAWDASPANSQDHLMLGAGEEWFYRALGGIDFDLSRPSPLTLRPALLDMDVDCAFRSALGLIHTKVTHTSAGAVFDVTVPVAARLELPPGALDLATNAPAPAEAAAGHHRYLIPKAPGS